MVVTNAGFGTVPPDNATWYFAILLFWLTSRVFYIFFIGLYTLSIIFHKQQILKNYSETERNSKK